MFDKLGQLAGLMRNLPRIQEEAARFQQNIGQLAAEGNAGAGMVSVSVNGRMELTGCRISPEVFKLDDREMLEDLVVAAANQALERVRSQVQEEMAKMASSLGLPPGMTLPGLG